MKPHRPTIVLAGGGHANLHTLLRTGELTRRGFDVLLIDPSEHLHYSGMATGVLSGAYGPGENRIATRRLVERGGGRFVRGSVAEVLHRDRALLLEDGRTIRYDAVSFCLGSETRGAETRGAGGTVPVKPVSNLQGVRERLLASASGEPLRVVIVGGGAAGCEVAANLAALAREAGSGAKITLVEAGPNLLPNSPGAARRIMTEHLGNLGVGVIPGQEARLRDNAVHIDGMSIRADLTLAATGVAPPDVFARSGLATGDDGAMWVDRHLRSPNETRIFGGGDAVAFRGDRLPQFGVYAVRQGPILYRNLQAVLRGEPLLAYKPQRRYLYVLDLGDGTGLAIYGSLTNRSRPALRLKRRIDRRFMEQYS